MSRSMFTGIKLSPGQPHALHVPEGELLQLQQVALATPASKETVAVVSIKCQGHPELVVCTLREKTAMASLELMVTPDDHASLHVRGAKVDVCAHFVPDDDDEEIDSEEVEVWQQHQVTH